MTERVVAFGEGRRLSGVLNAPAGGAGAPLLLFNAGIVHRIGPNRLNVKLARQAAAQGLTSLRMDLSGLGDSAAGAPGRGFREQAALDLAAGIDLLTEASGAPRVRMLGLCSGADNILRLLRAEERVQAVALLDPWAYPSPGGESRYLLSRAMDPSVVARRLSRLPDAVMGALRGADAEEARAVEAALTEDPDRGRPPREAFGEELQQLVRRGVKIHIIYSGLERRKLTAPEHFFNTFKEFDLKPGVTVDVRPEIDHTYTEQSAQAWLLRRMADWFSESV